MPASGYGPRRLSTTNESGKFPMYALVSCWWVTRLVSHRDTHINAGLAGG